MLRTIDADVFSSQNSISKMLRGSNGNAPCARSAPVWHLWPDTDIRLPQSTWNRDREWMCAPASSAAQQFRTVTCFIRVNNVFILFLCVWWIWCWCCCCCRCCCLHASDRCLRCIFKWILRANCTSKTHTLRNRIPTKCAFVCFCLLSTKWLKNVFNIKWNWLRQVK